MTTTLKVILFETLLRRTSGVYRRDREVGEYRATQQGLRRAFASAKRASYGQEPGRIAPRGKAFVVVAIDGKPVDEPTSLTGLLTIEPDEMDYLNPWTGEPLGKRSAFDEHWKLVERIIARRQAVVAETA